MTIFTTGLTTMAYDNWKTTNPADETLGSRKQHKPRHELPPGECVACDADRGQMHPSHDASPNCESGKRNHCSCDACF